MTDNPNLVDIERTFLITEKSAPNDVVDQIIEIAPNCKLFEIVAEDVLSGSTQLLETDLCIVYLPDELNAQVIPVLAKEGCTISVLPHKEAPQSVIGFGVHFDLKEAIKDSFSLEQYTVDMLKCNNELVLNSVEVGDFVGLKPIRMTKPSLLNRLKNFGKRLKEIHRQIPFKLTLTTQKGKTITTAVTAISVIEHSSNTRFVQQLIGESNINDGMFHAVFLAPRSLRQLLFGLIKNIVTPPTKLPEFIGHVRTGGMELTTQKEIEYRIDGRERRGDKLYFEIQNKSLQLVPGRYLKVDRAAAHGKEAFRTQHLPTADAVPELVSKTLPWNIHAGTEEFRELYQSLRENASTSGGFLTLMALSTMLATLGLFANSAPVIIGAMILAPLMAPIVSLAMSTVRQDQSLMTQSSKTLLNGLLLALSCGSLLSLMIPLNSLTQEMSARVSPNLLDLGVAIISGIAAAYANSRSEVAKSLAGVAIAVALVPPLATTGVAIAWMDLDMILGSFLLFLTNLSGIVLAAAITFSWLGFSPFRRAQKGLLITVIITTLISIPLALSFVNMVQNNTWTGKVSSLQLKDAQIKNVKIFHESPLLVRFDLVVPNYPSEVQIEAIKKQLEQSLERPVELEMTLVIRR
ncbi:TIGR00341 family protein [Catenovulum sp. 2E275]|uniref:TIGR00341 family protein n=1 Tax=Catenovulum sp. 2E275 TaxID=2980497 RepID=UPI0021CE45C6|nr:TIGR00341 family protein [Catenovulum sp. 2E275]MCU4676603.1 TIGR00341 family protein [Catenovulum sp. 2E275]